MSKPFKPLRGVLMDLETSTWPKLVSAKIDGIRVLVRDGVVYSKNLKLIPQPTVQAALGRPEYNGFDAEITVGKSNDEGVYARTFSFVMSSQQKQEDFRVNVFDDFTLPETPYRHRLGRVLSRCAEMQGGIILPVHHSLVANKEEAIRGYEWLLDEGYEGAIFRDPEAPYKFGQCTAIEGYLLKWKPVIDFTAEVLDVFEKQHNGNQARVGELGQTVRSSHKANKSGKGTLGGLIARDLDSGEVFRCGIFKGLKDADLQKLWDDHVSGVAPLTGRFFDAQKMGYGQKVRPRHPRWLRWRDARDVSLPD
jgi:DNA ligase-1